MNVSRRRPNPRTLFCQECGPNPRGEFITITQYPDKTEEEAMRAAAVVFVNQLGEHPASSFPPTGGFQQHWVEVLTAERSHLFCVQIQATVVTFTPPVGDVRVKMSLESGIHCTWALEQHWPNGEVNDLKVEGPPQMAGNTTYTLTSLHPNSDAGWVLQLLGRVFQMPVVIVEQGARSNNSRKVILRPGP